MSEFIPAPVEPTVAAPVAAPAPEAPIVETTAAPVVPTPTAEVETPAETPELIDPETARVNTSNAVVLAQCAELPVASMLSDLAADGIDLQGVFGKAAESGNLGDVDVDALAAKLGSRTAARGVIAELQSVMNAQNVQAEAVRKEVIEHAGGQEAWDAATMWASMPGAIPESTRTELNALLEQGGTAAKLAVQHFMQMYRQSAVFSEDKLINPEAVSAAGGLTPIKSRMEYSQLMKAAKSPMEASMITQRWINSKQQYGL